MPSRLTVLAVLGGSLAVCGCQDMLEAPRLAPGVLIAVDTIDGPPANVQAALNAAFATAAAAHKIVLVDDAQSPRFRLRGYLTATPTEDGHTSLAYVWDLFDAGNQRAQRVTGTDIVAGDAADPWSPVDDKALREVADKSMDGIAAFLASLPPADAPADAPAVAAATPTSRKALTQPEILAGTATGTGANAPAKPLGYAPAE